MILLAGSVDGVASPAAEQVEMLCAADIRWLELRSAWRTNVLDLTDQQLRTFAGLLRERGVGVSCVCGPAGGADVPAYREGCRRALAVAAAVGAPFVRLWAPARRTGPAACAEDDEADRAAAVAAISACVSAAGSGPVGILLENRPGTWADTPERCVALVRGIGGGVQHLCDCDRYAAIGHDPAQAYATVERFTAYVRVPADAVLQAPDGPGPFPRLWTALAQRRRDLFLSLALPTGGDADGAMRQRLVAAAQAVRRLLGAVCA